MRTWMKLGAAALALTFLASTSASAQPAIPLSGGQETQEADHNGHGFFTYDIDGTTFCYTLTFSRIETATAAHIHKAPRHVAGSIVIPLSVGDGSGAPVSDCVDIDADLAADLAANPKGYYVNVHNEPFPAGAIRGQLK